MRNTVTLLVWPLSIIKIHTSDARLMETVVGTELIWTRFMTESSNLPAVKHLEYEGDINPI
jgi:hypothetical protein